MALQHTELTDLSQANELNELNRMLRELIQLVNQGGEIRVETARISEKNAVSTEVTSGDSKIRLRARQEDPSEGGRVRLQFFDGKEWQTL